MQEHEAAVDKDANLQRGRRRKRFLSNLVATLFLFFFASFFLFFFCQFFVFSSFASFLSFPLLPVFCLFFFCHFFPFLLLPVFLKSLCYNTAYSFLNRSAAAAVTTEVLRISSFPYRGAHIFKAMRQNFPRSKVQSGISANQLILKSKNNLDAVVLQRSS